MSQATGDVGKARVIAFIIDNVIASILTLALAATIESNDSLLDVILILPLFLSYFYVFEITWGRTPGKFLMGLEVLDVSGLPCTAAQIFVRTVTRLVEVNPILFGAVPAALAIATSKKHQRLGDLMAGTVVVSRKTQSMSTHQP